MSHECLLSKAYARHCVPGPSPEENTDVRRFLYACRDAVHDLRSIERQRDAVRFPQQGMARAGLSPGGRDRDPTTTALNQLDYYDALLEQKRDALAREFLRLEDMLSFLESHISRAILRYYFAQGMSNPQVAEAVGLTERTAGEKRRAAVRWLERHVGELGEIDSELRF